MGFSLGSAIAVFVAKEQRHAVKGIICYTLPGDMACNYLWYFERFNSKALDKLHQDGRVWMKGLDDYITMQFLDDLPRHDVKKAIQAVTCPILLIQPTDDDQVPRWISDEVYALKPYPKERIDIKGTHTLSSEKGWDEHQEGEVTTSALNWLTTNL
jgi:esterase/lipase